MKITPEYVPDNDSHNTHRLTRITIDIEPGDDPHNNINGLVFGRERLLAWLTAYGSLDNFEKTEDRWGWLVHLSFVGNMTETRYQEALWIAKDTWGMSWRQLESATEMPQATIRRRVRKVREDYANSGYWRDREGLHRNSPDHAKGVCNTLEFADIIDGGDDCTAEGHNH